MQSRTSGSPIRYRRLERGDLGTLRSLNEVFAAAFEDTETHLSRKPGDPYLRELLSKSKFIAIAALSGDSVVGGLVAYVLDKYEQERSEIYLYDLAVDERYRRQGIARQLIHELRAVARAIGAWVIFVQADRVDTPAVNLYRSLGAQEEPLHFDIGVAD